MIRRVARRWRFSSTSLFFSSRNRRIASCILFFPRFRAIFEESVCRAGLTGFLPEYIFHGSYDSLLADVSESDLEPDDLVAEVDLGFDDAAHDEPPKVLLVEKDSGFGHLSPHH